MKSFWKNSGEIAARLAAAKKLLVALDFDGTLAALAETPAKARLSAEFRLALRELAAAPGVAVFVLSGRALANVRRLVDIAGIYYGGNHGIEIAGPGFFYKDKPASASRELVAAIAAGIAERFPPGTGVLVEDKVFSASVHYRNLKKPYMKGFFAHVKALTGRPGKGLCWRRGHKVFEILPCLASHKGGAVSRLKNRLRAGETLAVGDDLTDEDMFRALGPGGMTARVGRSRSSAAAYFLERQSEVLRLLRFIRALRRERGGGQAFGRDGRKFGEGQKRGKLVP